jgi:hypothetical protein
VAAKIDIQGLDPLMARLARARSGGLQKDLVDTLQRSATPIRQEMSAAAFTRIQHRAMDSVDTSKIAEGIEITGGQGGGLGAVLFAGAEFGGRKSKKVTYPTTSRLGRPYTVRRKTTMQFLPHLGREGYFYWPTLRVWLPRLRQRLVDVVNTTLAG